MKEAHNRISSMINRAVLARADNATKNQTWVLRGVENQDKEVEVFEPYGMTSLPPVGQAETLRFAMEGYEDHCMVLAGTGGEFRPTDGKPGEVIIYSQWDKGSKHRVHFSEEKQGIALLSGENSLVLDNEKLVITIGGNTFTMTADGITSTKDAEFEGTSVHTHKHDGVRTGAGVTGEPV